MMMKMMKTIIRRPDEARFKRTIFPHRFFMATFLALLAFAFVSNSSVSCIAQSAPRRNQPRTIREIDFFNFTHRIFCLDDSGRRNRVAIRNGEYSLEDGGYFLVRSVTYGDLNRDGRDEAVVIMACNGGGTGSFTEGIIYTMRGGRPVIVGEVVGGDRAHEGIATVGIRDGLLRVGRYGTNTGGACCPEYVETKTYRLANNALTEAGRPARSASRDFAAPSPPAQQIVFARNTTRAAVTDRVEFIKAFTVRARAGQRLTVRLSSTDANDHSLIMRLRRGGEGDELSPHVTRSLRGSLWSGILPQSGEYTIEVISFNEAQDMRLEVSITDR